MRRTTWAGREVGSASQARASLPSGATPSGAFPSTAASLRHRSPCPLAVAVVRVPEEGRNLPRTRNSPRPRGVDPLLSPLPDAPFPARQARCSHGLCVRQVTDAVSHRRAPSSDEGSSDEQCRHIRGIHRRTGCAHARGAPTMPRRAPCGTQAFPTVFTARGRRLTLSDRDPKTVDRQTRPHTRAPWSRAAESPEGGIRNPERVRAARRLHRLRFTDLRPTPPEGRGDVARRVQT